MNNYYDPRLAELGITFEELNSQDLEIRRAARKVLVTAYPSVEHKVCIEFLDGPKLNKPVEKYGVIIEHRHHEQSPVCVAIKPFNSSDIKRRFIALKGKPPEKKVETPAKVIPVPALDTSFGVEKKEIEEEIDSEVEMYLPEKVEKGEAPKITKRSKKAVIMAYLDWHEIPYDPEKNRPDLLKLALN